MPHQYVFRDPNPRYLEIFGNPAPNQISIMQSVIVLYSYVTCNCFSGVQKLISTTKNCPPDRIWIGNFQSSSMVESPWMVSPHKTPASPLRFEASGETAKPPK